MRARETDDRFSIRRRGVAWQVSVIAMRMRRGTYVALRSRVAKNPGGSRAPQPLRVAPSLPRVSARRRHHIVEWLGCEVYRRYLRQLCGALPRGVSSVLRASPRRGRAAVRRPPPHRLSPLASFLQNAPILATPAGRGYALDARTRAYLARVAKLADAPDLGSGGPHSPWGFDSPLSHQSEPR